MARKKSRRPERSTAESVSPRGRLRSRTDKSSASLPFCARVRRPVQVIWEAGGRKVSASPLIALDAAGDTQLSEFAAADVLHWSLLRARRKTPWYFSPEGFTPLQGFPSAEALMRAIYRDIAPPRLQEERFRLGLDTDCIPPAVIERWWTRRLAGERGIDVARELRTGRRAHRLLLAAFPRHLRRRRPFDAMPPSGAGTSARSPDSKVVEDTWNELQRAVLRLVEFRRTYLAAGFALFAVRFAAQTEFGLAFFPKLSIALVKKGEDARRDHVNATRWELCYRVLTSYDRHVDQGVPYHRIRKIIIKTMVNFEFLRDGWRVLSVETARKWLDRNGW